MNSERILIIEDELAMRTALADVLAGEGYRVLTACDGQAGLQRAVSEQPDLVLLDIMMPKLDGYAVCGELRRRGKTVPILMLTAKGLIEDRVQGLDVGADDYLVKPFSTEELLARVRALLRRTRRQEQSIPKLRLGDIEIDLVRQTAARGRRELHLTTKEYAMLRLLADAGGEPVSRERWLVEHSSRARHFAQQGLRFKHQPRPHDRLESVAQRIVVGPAPAAPFHISVSDL